MRKKSRQWYWTAPRLNILVECLKKLGALQEDGTYVIPTPVGLARSVAPHYWKHDEEVQVSFVQKGLSALVALGVINKAKPGDQRNCSRYLNPAVVITDEAVEVHRLSL